MKKLAAVAGPPLISGQTEIIERGLVHIESRRVRVRPQHINVLRRDIQNLSKLAFALADLLFGQLCRGNVRHGTHKFEVA